jgi:TldD protein
VRVDEYDAVIGAARDTARSLGLYIIVRVQDQVERRLTVASGAIERRRTTRLAGVGLHVFTIDGSAGFASTDDVRPNSIADAVRRAGALAGLARSMGGARMLAPVALPAEGRRRLPGTYRPLDGADPTASVRATIEAQDGVRTMLPDYQVRTSQHIVDEQWRVARSDGTDVSFATPRATLRHDISGRAGSAVIRASAVVSGADAASTLMPSRLAVLAKRAILAARRSAEVAIAPPPRAGPCRIVLDYALAKGLAHEAIGHLCESDVDASVFMRQGRLRLGDRLARPTVSIVDGPIAGEYADQPISANGQQRETVAIVEDGILAAGLGDPFSAAQAGITQTSACRAASFRDRPTPRMTTIRVVVRDPLVLTVDPEDLTPEVVAATLRDVGFVDGSVPTLYLTGYRGGQAHPRRGDFIFAADAAYEITSEGAAPRRPSSFSGLAERALAAIVAGIGPLRLDAVGSCSKDGSVVSSSGGSHALLVLDPDPDLVVSAAT